MSINEKVIELLIEQRHTAHDHLIEVEDMLSYIPIKGNIGNNLDKFEKELTGVRASIKEMRFLCSEIKKEMEKNDEQK
jgi:hypothetical protein